jgi:hypothetical protein
MQKRQDPPAWHTEPGVTGRSVLGAPSCRHLVDERRIAAGLVGRDRPTVGAKTDNAIRRASKKGDAGIRKIATRLCVGTGTVRKIKAELSA